MTEVFLLDFENALQGLRIATVGVTRNWYEVALLRCLEDDSQNQRLRDSVGFTNFCRLRAYQLAKPAVCKSLAGLNIFFREKDAAAVVEKWCIEVMKEELEVCSRNTQKKIDMIRNCYFSNELLAAVQVLAKQPKRPEQTCQ